MNVSPGCMETGLAEICMCECSGLCGNRAVDISHSECAGPCVEAGSRTIRPRECGSRGRGLTSRPAGFSESVCLGAGCVIVTVSVRERVRDRVLGVRPYGLWTLAVWRCLICARRLGSDYQVPEDQSTPPIPQVPQCP